jgi:abequosyltransferase
VNQPVLTIAIPTFNRSGCLSLCLSTLIPQVQAAGDEVELIISDNASTDDTQDVVQSCITSGVSLLYLRNESNVGADRNFVQCFRRARGKYLLLLGDDDVLLSGALEKLLPILKSKHAGVVHFKGYGFRNDFLAEQPRRPRSGKVVEYRNPRAFAAKVNINLTFISGNVVNRSLVGDRVRFEDCLDTNLVQLGWIVPAALAASTNVVFDEFLVAAKAENTGGYRLCEVFGLNLNALFEQFIAQGMDPGFFTPITKKTISQFFPQWILKLRSHGGDFHPEDHFETLRPAFHRHASFWIMVWPAARWPLPVAKFWFKLCKHALKLFRRW